MSENGYEVIILGTGPAGLQAAIHAARAKVSVLVLGKQNKSSLYRAHLENFCCLREVSGDSLLRVGREQAEGSGARFLDEDAVKVSPEETGFRVTTEGGTELRCRALILALGISRNKLNVPGEKALLGRGVSYCVDCDANFYRGEPVAVVGCESAALTGSLTLLFYAREVHLVCEALQGTEALARRIKDSAIQVHEGRKVAEILGTDRVEGVLLDDGSRLEVSGVFIELGAKGAVELAGELGVALDAETMKYIETNKKQQTNVPGVYAAGDICGPPWQMAIAVGQGCLAGLEAAAYVKRLR